MNKTIEELYDGKEWWLLTTTDKVWYNYDLVDTFNPCNHRHMRDNQIKSVYNKHTHKTTLPMRTQEVGDVLLTTSEYVDLIMRLDLSDRLRAIQRVCIQRKRLTEAKAKGEPNSIQINIGYVTYEVSYYTDEELENDED